jgi:shikimate kinase
MQARLYLVGFMGAGKTTIGGIVADLQGQDFVDLDAHIEQRVGMKIPEIFSRRGEAVFRAAELDALVWTSGLDDVVVATGGGAMCSPEGRMIMHARGGRTVFLDLPWEVIVERIGDAFGERPKFGSVARAKHLFEERQPLYRQASVTVVLDGSESPNRAAEMVQQAVAGVACGT